MHDLTHLTADELLETRAVLKSANVANRYLAELKGIAQTIPNESILINTLSLQEAKDSSEVENIVTTHDELFQAAMKAQDVSIAGKEASMYGVALRTGFQSIRERGVCPLSLLLKIHTQLECHQGGLRRTPGTNLKNAETGEIIYEPPQHPDEIKRLMDDLIDFMHVDERRDLDPLVKMAIIHHQFQSIHPFYDGNGRTGRIINVLYLVMKGLLDLPVLYLSRYIVRHKGQYYHHLQNVRDTGDWEPYLLYMMEAIAETAQHSIGTIGKIRDLMAERKSRLRKELPKIYSQDLLNLMFKHPCTKIAFTESELGVSRITATKYLELLTERDFLRKRKIGRTNYFLNEQLIRIFEQG